MLKIRIYTILLGLFFSFPVFSQDIILRTDEVPTEIMDYINEHLPEEAIHEIKKEVDGHKVEYEVAFMNGISLEFDKKFEIKEIQSKYGISKAQIPASIYQYVEGNYPGARIEEWKLEGFRQKIELNNDLELYFDSKGKFIGIDD